MVGNYTAMIQFSIQLVVRRQVVISRIGLVGFSDFQRHFRSPDRVVDLQKKTDFLPEWVFFIRLCFADSIQFMIIYPLRVFYTSKLDIFALRNKQSNKDV